MKIYLFLSKLLAYFYFTLLIFIYLILCNTHKLYNNHLFIIVILADDTFNTFEEVLQLAVKHKVDFILLAGDLFHINQPSVASLERCISLLRTYCLGDK